MSFAKYLAEKLHKPARQVASIDAKKNQVAADGNFDPDEWDSLNAKFKKAQDYLWKRKASQDKRWAEKDREISDKHKIYYQGQSLPTKDDIKNRTDQQPQNLKLRPRKPSQ